MNLSGTKTSQFLHLRRLKLFLLLVEEKLFNFHLYWSLRINNLFLMKKKRQQEAKFLQEDRLEVSKMNLKKKDARKYLI
jgi:hypothetical protein